LHTTEIKWAVNITSITESSLYELSAKIETLEKSARRERAVAVIAGGTGVVVGLGGAFLGKGGQTLGRRAAAVLGTIAAGATLNASNLEQSAKQLIIQREGVKDRIDARKKEMQESAQRGYDKFKHDLEEGHYQDPKEIDPNRGTA
jgi:hypothetical protein